MCRFYNLDFNSLSRMCFVFVISFFLLISCGEKMDGPVIVTPHQIKTPLYFPTNLNIPEDNPLTEEGIQLGRYLFYDGRLSGRTHPDSLMSCASCHLQKNAFECGIDHPIYIGGQPHGIHGDKTPHVMLPLINLVYNENGYLWNGKVSRDNPDSRFRNIEDLVWMGVMAPHEMAGDTTRVKELFNSIPEYRTLFYNAFGQDEITFDLVSKAIAQFIRVLISSDSKFDQYLRGEYQLSMSELNGYDLFTTEEGADCFHCHGGGGNVLFTSNLFYNNGKDSIFTGQFEDPGDRYHFTNDENDRGAYKATTLRNIELTGPYMHDGRYKTLDEVIDFYSHHILYSPYVNS
ncbi:MAG: hypothetical protein JEZ03_11940, partial [Bacteroidales bacterium]|nr:hypothetical protein [Bacteroidales bacterium]